jgi:hypothetical protein
MKRFGLKSIRRPSPQGRPVVTTLGDLVAAAYEAVPGLGRDRLVGALRLLTRSPLARSVTPRLRFV